MKLRQNHPTEIAAVKADISRATGYRIAQDPRLRSLIQDDAQQD